MKEIIVLNCYVFKDVPENMTDEEYEKYDKSHIMYFSIKKSDLDIIVKKEFNQNMSADDFIDSYDWFESENIYHRAHNLKMIISEYFGERDQFTDEYLHQIFKGCTIEKSQYEDPTYAE